MRFSAVCQSLLRCGRSRSPGTRSFQMTRYLISFDAHAMDHIPDEDLPAVAKAAHEVVEEAMNAGVWVFGGGLENQKASIGSWLGGVEEFRELRLRRCSSSSTRATSLAI